MNDAVTIRPSVIFSLHGLSVPTFQYESETLNRPASFATNVQFCELEFCPKYFYMHRYKTISLIDPETRRRAEHSAAIMSERFHVEPYESLAEFRSQGNTDTLVLIHDDGQSLPMLIQDMRERDYWAPALGYGRDLDPVSFSKLLLMGFLGYLPDRFDQHDVSDIFDDSTEEMNSLIDLRYEAAESRRKLKRLTSRETEVLDHLALGLRNREIAERLDISARTVEIHRANVLRKMELTSAFTAIRMSVRAAVGG